jgi:hypothetical protein
MTDFSNNLTHFFIVKNGLTNEELPNFRKKDNAV